MPADYLLAFFLCIGCNVWVTNFISLLSVTISGIRVTKKISKKYSIQGTMYCKLLKKECIFVLLSELCF